MHTLKYPLFTNWRKLLTVFALSGIGLLFVACGKDDPEPGPVPPDPVPPTPPTPVVPDAPRAVALRLLALPAGDNHEPWSVADTLHLVLAEPNGRTALGDTFSRSVQVRMGLSTWRILQFSAFSSSTLPSSPTNTVVLVTISSLMESMGGLVTWANICLK